MISAIGNDKKGLTFIELFIVILIIAILAGISIPSFKRTFDNLQLNSFAKDTQSLMNYLQQRSKVENRVIALRMSPEDRKLSASYLDDAKIIKTSVIPQGVSININQDQILFYPDGSMDKVNINLSNQYNNKIVLTTKGVFNAISIQQE